MSPLWSGRWAITNLLIRLRFPQVRSIAPVDLADWLHQDQPPSLLDARTSLEYQVSHLPQAHWVGSDLHAVQNLPHLTPTTPIVVYCSVGYRSAKLAQKLQHQGYHQVLNLTGSIFAWANQGYPVYQGSQPVKQVHPYNATWGQLLHRPLHRDSP